MMGSVATAIIDEYLATIGMNRASVGLEVVETDGITVMGTRGIVRIRTGDDPRLGVERLLTSVRAQIEASRLAAMMSAVGGDGPHLWSIRCESMVKSWLDWGARRMSRLRRSRRDEELLASADADGPFTARTTISGGRSSLRGDLRERELHARIRLSPSVSYDGDRGELHATAPIPETLAAASPGLRLGDLLALPSELAGQRKIIAASVSDCGTVIRLERSVVPLADIPSAAVLIAPSGSDPVAPWRLGREEAERLAEREQLLSLRVAVG